MISFRKPGCVTLALFNGDIRTQDARRPRARAVAVAGGRILAVGSDEEILPLAGRGTDIRDLEGGLVLPGMIDGHFHYYDWALGRRNLKLAGVRSFQALMDRVAAAARTKPPGAWILGQGWNEADWPEMRMPTRDDLDGVAPVHPVALWRCDLHLAAVNTRALELAGIGEATPDPPEGVIERNAAGRPTGILREHAPNLVKAVIPAPKDEEVMAAMTEGMGELHSLGLTGIQDVYLMGGGEGAQGLRAWQGLRERDVLALRCWVSLPGERLQEAVALGLRTGLGDERLRLGYVKFYADGGMGARTAWMLEPYLDAQEGMPLMDMRELEAAVFQADGAGLAVMVHAIGDRANRELIGIFERLAADRAERMKNSPPRPPVPHRIEHVQMIREEDLQRLARLPVAACVQPHNMILDIAMIDACMGPRGRWTYAYGDMLRHGIALLFSSDAPVCDPSPLVGIHAAVTRARQDETPPGGWYGEQRIPVDAAVKAYTLTPARAFGVDRLLGSLTPGKRADLIVLDRNIYEEDPARIHKARVMMTVFDGQLVYER